MLAAKRIPDSSYSSFRTGLFWLSFVGFAMGIGGGCAAGEAASGGAQIGPRPPASCEQYLALLSEERKQALETQYGAGGSCWTGTRQQAQECDSTCGREVNQIIRSSLNKSDS